jgi:hypothetical protein
VAISLKITEMSHFNENHVLSTQKGVLKHSVCSKLGIKRWSGKIMVDHK